MSSKEQIHSDDKATAKSRSSRREVQNIETLTQQTYPANIIRGARVAPSSLTSRDVLRLQRTIGNQAVGRLLAGARTVHPTVQRASGEGQLPERTVQKQVSETMGHDFSGVRVHSDSEPDALSTQLMAKAFTTGPDIFFKRGAYDPTSSSGRELIAHKLSHVVQQSTGRVRGGGNGMTVRPAGDTLEKEVDAQAGAAVTVRQVANHSEADESEGLNIQRRVEKGKAALNSLSSKNESARNIIQRKRSVSKVRRSLKISGHEHLMEGIEESQSQGKKFDLLVKNFSNRTDWKYTGGAFTWKHGGNCQSICQEFIIIANDLGIECELKPYGKHGHGIFIKGQHPAVGLKTDGNVNGGEHWFFSHGHAVVETKMYGEADILFKDAKLDYTFAKRHDVKGETSWDAEGIQIWQGGEGDPSREFTFDREEYLRGRRERREKKAKALESKGEEEKFQEV